jgi:hypothetical protein
VKEGEPIDQTLPPVRVLLLLALAGTGVLKQGFSGIVTIWGSGAIFSVWFLGFSDETPPVPARYGVENSEKESSTKWDNHSRLANSSTGTESSVVVLLFGTGPNWCLVEKLVLVTGIELSCSSVWFGFNREGETESKPLLSSSSSGSCSGSSSSTKQSSLEKLRRSSTKKSSPFSSKLVLKVPSTHSIFVSNLSGKKREKEKKIRAEMKKGLEEERVKMEEEEGKRVVSWVKH